jgi:hypothetical protein
LALRDVGAARRWRCATLALRDVGAARRWRCAMLALVLSNVHHVTVSVETVRRWLHREQMVWRRPRPVLQRKDVNRSRKLQIIRQLLAGASAGSSRVLPGRSGNQHQSQNRLHVNAQGKQAKLPTPSDNHKRYLVGSMDWRSGTLIATEGKGRNADLFLAHLDQLRCRYRTYHMIHVICDNASFHTAKRSKKVAEYLRKVEAPDRCALPAQVRPGNRSD